MPTLFSRHSAYLALALGFVCSLLLGAEFDLVRVVSDVRPRHQKLELDELLSVSGLFSLFLAGFAAWNSRLAGRERRRRAEAEQHANVDALTGIANRRRFFEQLEAVFVGPRAGRMCAVVLLDLDGFKAINDTHGHAAGDHLLKHVARQISSLQTRHCLAARLGGDEFVLLVEGAAASTVKVEQLIGRLRTAIATPVRYGSVDLTVGATFGAAFMSDDMATSADLLEAADGEMYRVKRRNRDRLAA